MTTHKYTAPKLSLNWSTIVGGAVTAVLVACIFAFYRLDRTMTVVQTDLTYIKGSLNTQDTASKSIYQALDIRVRTLEIEVAILKDKKDK